jgi:hypothetical protein
MTYRASVVRCVIVVLLAGLVSSIAATSESGGRFSDGDVAYFSRPQTAPADAILILAKRAVAANDMWAETADYLKPEQNPDGSWTVLVSRRPKTPNGYRVITVGSDGTVQQYLRVQ